MPAGDQPRPANLSGSFEAKRRHTSSWSSPRMFTQNAPVASIFGHEEEPLSGEEPDERRSSETELNDPTASPTGPSSAAAVITVTPVGKWPRTWRYWAESNGRRGHRAPNLPGRLREAR